MQTRAGLLCPVCHVELRGSERQGVAVACCPECRGVWLDRDELDKLIAHDHPAAPSMTPNYRLPDEAIDHGHANADLRPDDTRQQGRIREHDRSAQRKRDDRRRNWPGALFDVD